MNPEYERDETINEKAIRCREMTGKRPTILRVSREIYRQLVELKSLVCCVGELVVGCVSLTEIQTNVGKLKVVVDELLNADSVRVE